MSRSKPRNKSNPIHKIAKLIINFVTVFFKLISGFSKKLTVKSWPRQKSPQRKKNKGLLSLFKEKKLQCQQYLNTKKGRQQRKFVLNFFLTFIFTLSLSAFNSWFVYQRAVAQASTTLAIEPITWDFVGLDSNKPESQGPNTYVVGARVCNMGTEDARNVTVKFVKDGVDNGYAYIRLQSADTYVFDRVKANLPANDKTVADIYGRIKLTTGSIGSYVFDTRANGGLYKTKYQIKYTPVNCQDFYYNFEVTRTDAAWNTYQKYYLEATASNAVSVRTESPRQNYIEKLISQARNEVYFFGCDSTGGTNYNSPNVTVQVGDTFTCQARAHTATAYPQMSFTSDIPNVVFQVLDVQSTYSNPPGGVNSTVYADGCGWVNDPSDPRYHLSPGACSSETGFANVYSDQYPYTAPPTEGKGGVGNDITTIYKIKVIAFPNGIPNPIQVSNVILDYSGSSYHYNADYGIAPNVIYITVEPPSPTDLSIDKSHSDPFGYGNRQYQLVVSDNNNGSSAKAPVILTDTLPAGYTFVDKNTPLSGTQPLSNLDGSITGVIANWNCDTSGQVLTCLYDTDQDGIGDNFPDNYSETLYLNVNIPQTIPSGTTSTNFAKVTLNSAQTDSNLANNTDSDPTLVLQGVDIVLTKDDNVDDPTEETFNGNGTSTATYRITASNNSGSNANGPLTIVDTLPIGFKFTGTYSGSNNGTNWFCEAIDLTGSIVSCTNSRGLNDTESTTLNLTVNVLSSAEDMDTNVTGVQAINTATISSASNEINYSNNTATQTNKVDKPAPDLVVSKTDNNIEFIYDSNSPVTSSYFITVTNKTGTNIIATTGPITVVDTLPSQLDPAVLSPLSAGDPDGLNEGWSCTYNSTTRQITCINNNPLAPGDSSIIQVKVKPNTDPGAAPATINVTNTVRVDTPGEIENGDGNFTTSGDNDSQDTTIIRQDVRSVDVAVNKTDNEIDPVPLGPVGSTVIYTIDVTTGGQGNYQVDSGLFEDNIPSGVNVTAATCTRIAAGASGNSFTKCCNGYGPNGAPGGGDDIIAPTTDNVAVNIFGNYNSTTRKLVCNGYAMAKSATLRLLVTGTINQSGQFLNTVNVNPGNDTLGAAIQDRDPTNNFSSELTTITGVDLSLAKSVLPTGPYKIGDIITYRLAVKNESTTTASTGSMTVIDPLPSQVEYINAQSASGSSGWSCGHNDASNTVTCVNSNSLAASATSSIDITVKIIGSGTIDNGDTFTGRSTITNIARVGSGGATANRTVTITTSTAHGYLVGDRVLVDASNDTFDGTFTITAVPTTTTFQYIQGAAAVASTPATGTINLLYPQDTRQKVKLIKVGDPVITNNASNAQITVPAPQVDLQITKTEQTAPFSIGQTEVYRLTVKNLGTTDTAQGPLTIVDQLPAGLTFQYATTVPAASLPSPAIEKPWSCSASGQTVTCINYSNLAAGTTTGVDLYVQVGSASGSVINQARVTSSSDICTDFTNANCDDDQTTPTVNPAVNLNSDRYDNKTQITTTINPQADLAIVKTAVDQDSVTAGNQFSKNGPGVYTITVTNNGPSAYSGNVIFNDDLAAIADPDFTFNSFTGTSTVRSISNVAVSGNVVTITTSGNHGFIIGDRVNVNSSVTAVNGTNLQITGVTANTFTYSQTTSNLASTSATGTVTAAWSCTVGATTTACTAGATNLKFTKPGGLLAGESSTITLTVNVPNVTGTNLTNTATIDNATIIPANDTVASNNSSSTQVTVTTDDTTVTLEKDDNDGDNNAEGSPANPINYTPDEPENANLQTKFFKGGIGRYTIVARNTGTSPAKNLTISETTAGGNPLPTGLTYAGYSRTTNWNCTGTINSQEFSCQYGTWNTGFTTFTPGELPAGAMSGVEILVNVSPTVTASVLTDNDSNASTPDIYTGLITNTAKVTWSNPTNSSATATEQTVIIEPADLAVTKSITLGNPPDLNTNETATYTITVTNNGPGTSYPQIYLQDYLPTGLIYTGATSGVAPGDGTWTIVGYNVGSNEVTYKRTTPLNSGATTTISLPVATYFSITNVSVTSNVVTITTSQPHGYSIGKTVNVAANTNTGVNGTDLIITDVPSSTTFKYNKTTSNVSSSDSGTVMDSTLPASVTNFVRVGGFTPEPDYDLVTPGYQDPKLASCDASLGANQPVNNCFALTTPIVGGTNADIQVLKKHPLATDPDTTPGTEAEATVDSVAYNTNFAYTIDVKNNSTTTAAETVSLSDPLPASLQFVSVAIDPTDISISNPYGTGTLNRTCGYDSLAKRINCSLYRVAANDTVTITVTVKGVVSGIVNNTVTVTSNTADLTPGNNSDSEPVLVGTGGTNNISGKVFNDLNNSGPTTIDSGETGTTNVKVNLYQDNGTVSGAYDTGDTLLATTTTDSNGDYSFTTDLTGTFIVKIDTTTLPSGNNLTLTSSPTSQYTASLPSTPTSVINQNFGHRANAIPKLNLVKRITAINGTNITGYVAGTVQPGSDATDTKWPGSADFNANPQYLRGAIACNAGNACNTVEGVKPNDIVEYTIYFLSNGTDDLQNVQLCDRIPTNTTFQPDTYTTGKGILLGWDTQATPTTLPDPTNNSEVANIKKWLTNNSGDDQGEFIDKTTALPSVPCGGSTTNDNGAILVKLGNTTIVPQATGAGTPINSYGFIRFNVKVK